MPIITSPSVSMVSPALPIPSSLEVCPSPSPTAPASLISTTATSLQPSAFVSPSDHYSRGCPVLRAPPVLVSAPADTGRGFLTLHSPHDSRTNNRAALRVDAPFKPAFAMPGDF